MSYLCGCGGIGRRVGFKIRCPLGRAGSSPATRTIIKVYDGPVMVTRY